MFDYAPNSGTSATVYIGNVNTSDIVEGSPVVPTEDVETANGNLGTGHSGHLSRILKKCDENPGHCSDGQCEQP
jgi:hypothetical protein